MDDNILLDRVCDGLILIDLCSIPFPIWTPELPLHAELTLSALLYTCVRTSALQLEGAQFAIHCFAVLRS